MNVKVAWCVSCEGQLCEGMHAVLFTGLSHSGCASAIYWARGRNDKRCQLPIIIHWWQMVVWILVFFS